MINIQKILHERFIEELVNSYERNYGDLASEYRSVIAWCGNLALENIAISDMLYHNMDHTIMVTMAGQEILRGKHLKEGGVSPTDWVHYILALLFHDIGYVKGICRKDEVGKFKYATGLDNEMVELSSASTDASLAPYHVDRGKQFVHERFDGHKTIDSDKLASYIEMTRFPVPSDEFHKDTKGLPGLTRAADFIGQLGDPNYMRKIPALFYEFFETGAHEKMGYKNPGDMRRNYSKFFWNNISPYIQDALGYLWVTQEGKLWISSLHAHVFAVEHLEDDEK